MFASNCAAAGNRTFVPRGGYSVPTGSVSGTWQPGYSLELNVFGPEINDMSFGVRFGFQRWIPNAEDLLKTGSREFNIEKNEGWQAISELSGLVSYRLTNPHKGLGAVRIEGGFGACRISRQDVYVKGFHVSGNTALNRDISIKDRIEVKPGVSIGLTLDIADRIEPVIRYQYVFTSGEGTGILMFGIGLLAN